MKPSTFLETSKNDYMYLTEKGRKCKATNEAKRLKLNLCRQEQTMQQGSLTGPDNFRRTENMYKCRGSGQSVEVEGRV